MCTEPGTEPGLRALDNVGEPCGVIEIVHGRGKLAGLYRVHYPRSGKFRCVEAAELRPYNIGDSSLVEAQARAAQPTESRLPSSADEMPGRTPEEWQSPASIGDEIFVNDIDNCIKNIVADEALVQRLRQSSLT